MGPGIGCAGAGFIMKFTVANKGGSWVVGVLFVVLKIAILIGVA